jgi:hypothetical protein
VLIFTTISSLKQGPSLLLRLFLAIDRIDIIISKPFTKVNPHLEIKQLGKQVEYFSVSQLLASLYNRKRSKNIACALYKINETNKNRTLELDQT